MTHSAEQLEDILTGQAEAPDTMDPATRRLLTEHSAIRSRLSGLNKSVSVPAGLANRIRNQLAKTQLTISFASRNRRRVIRLLSRHTSALAAAAVLILAAGVWLWHDGSKTQAAQPLLYNIHQANLAGQNEFIADDNPADIAKRLQQRADMDVKLPCPHSGCEYLGSSLATFRNQTICSVLCRHGGKIISVLCLREKPETLGFRHRFESNGRTWWRCGYSDCSMVAVGLGDKTLVAVGEIGAESLQHLLETILANNRTAVKGCNIPS